MTLNAHKLTLGYRNHTVVPAVSLALEAGTITCLTGPNGCGKSTLLRALSGLLVPLAGEVTLDNKNLRQWPGKVLARRLALLPQSPSAPENMSVQQLVSHGRYPYQGLFGQNSQADINAVEWALEITGMSALRHRAFETLSGGERQRGWIALALAQQSDILLLDEPTTYLDMGHQLEILDLLATLNRDYQLTLVMVLHDINQACQYSDRILAMQEGCIIADGAPLEVMSESLLQTLFGVKTELIIRYEGEKAYPYTLPVCSQSVNAFSEPGKPIPEFDPKQGNKNRFGVVEDSSLAGK